MSLMTTSVASGDRGPDGSPSVLTHTHLVAAGSVVGTPSMIGSGVFGSALRKSAARRVSKYAATSTKMIMVATPVSVVT